jgi:hypothetical protein
VRVEEAVARDSGTPHPQARRPIRTHARLAPLLLSLGSTAFVVLLVVAAEMSAQAWAPDYIVDARGPYVFSDTYGWASRAGALLVVDGKRVSFNARGYRGRELVLPKAGDRTRVVVLGDSIAFGLRVSDEETFPHLLDVRDNGLEAGSLAVQGYGPDQELLVLLHEGLRDDPDVVVLAFCLANDFADAVLPVSLYDGRTPKPRFRLAGDRLVLDDANLRQSVPQRVHQWLSDSSHLFNRAAALGPRREPPLGIEWHARKREALRDEEYALRLNLALVRRMNALCRERGIDFLVATFPTLFAWEGKSWLAGTFVESLEAGGVRVVDMAARFRALGLTFDAVALDAIGHLSPLGHTIATEVLESEITSRTRRASPDRAPDGSADFSDRPAPRSARSGAGAR